MFKIMHHFPLVFWKPKRPLNVTSFPFPVKHRYCKRRDFLTKPLLLSTTFVGQGSLQPVLNATQEVTGNRLMVATCHPCNRHRFNATLSLVSVPGLGLKGIFSPEPQLCCYLIRGVRKELKQMLLWTLVSQCKT